MRARWELLGATALVAVTAVVSTAVAVRHAHATDARLRTAVLAGAHLSLLPLADGSVAPDGSTPTGYGVVLHNDGPVGVVVRAAALAGARALDLHTALPDQGDTELDLPEPSPCPAHRITTGLDHVDVQVEAAGGRRTLQLALPDPAQVREAVNGRCGLFPAAQALSTAISATSVRPGHLVLDLSAAADGSRPVELVGVHVAAGIEEQSVEHLPITLRTSSTPGLTPHVLTVRLTLRDCAPVRAGSAPTGDLQVVPQSGLQLVPGSEVTAPPRWFELQLDVRHPGEPVEQVTLPYPSDAADAFAAPCHVPPLPRGNAG